MGKDYTDIHKGIDKDAFKKGLEDSSPRVYSPGNADFEFRRSTIEDSLPEGATLEMPNKRAYGSSYSSGFTGYSNGGNAQYHVQRPYLPEYESPDRLYYPKNRLEANRYWRLFYEQDPLFGTAIEMYAQMMISSFDIVFDNESDKGVRNMLEDMCTEVEILNNLQSMVKEYLVLGEAIPNLFFDQTKGIWTSMNFLNQDDIEVIEAPLINMKPILNYIPDKSVIELFSGNSKEHREVQKKYPNELVSKIRSGQKLRLSPHNTSYIPRKLHPYETRGTSIASRMWRVWMMEDAIASASIALYRRAASALKIVKLGDPNFNYMPSPEQEAKVAQMLAQCELDPQSYFIHNYAISFETFGNQDRSITLNREFDTIEKIKLLALGMPKSVVSGDASFATAKSGLQVFLRRLSSFRQFFETVWLYPKFLEPIIKVNDLHKPVPSEVRHRYRIRKSSSEIEQNYLKPRIIWRNNLDPKVDVDLLQAYGQLKNSGFVISDSTLGNAVGLDPIEEIRKKAEEYINKEKVMKTTLGDTMYERYKHEQQANQPGAKPPGAPGSGAKPLPKKGPAPQDTGGMSAPPGSNEGGGSEMGGDLGIGSGDRGIVPNSDSL